MAYNKFKLDDIKDRLQLKIDDRTTLFDNVESIEVSDFLKQTLAENMPLALAIHTEKARSEMIVVPILIEVRKICNHEISLFSGVRFDVDRELGLTGTCDFILCRSPEQLTITTPVLVLVEAKNDNIKSGLGQCAAEMYAAQIFNERKGNSLLEIYGVVTTGSLWKFLKLTIDGIIQVDPVEYQISHLDRILSIISKMVS